MGKLWDWHKKMFNTPIIGFSYRNDGNGNEETRMFMGGSKFWWYKHNNMIEEQEDDEEEFDLFKKYKRELLK